MVPGLMDKNYWRCGAVVAIAVGESRLCMYVVLHGELAQDFSVGMEMFVILVIEL